MPDPHDYTPMPGFPSQGSANALPSRQPHLTSSGKLNSLFPAITRADQERGAGSTNRSAFGPPPGGWPHGILTERQMAPMLSPLKQRVIAGMRDLGDQWAGAVSGPLQLALGGVMGLLSDKLAGAPDEAVANGLAQFAKLIAYWQTGEGGPQEGGRDGSTTPPADGGASQDR